MSGRSIRLDAFFRRRWLIPGQLPVETTCPTFARVLTCSLHVAEPVFHGPTSTEERAEVEIEALIATDEPALLFRHLVQEVRRFPELLVYPL